MITTKRGKSTDLQVDVRANTGFMSQELPRIFRFGRIHDSL